LIVVSAVEILQGAAGVIALLEDDRLVPRASYGLPAGALAGLHPRLDRAILNVLGQLGEQVSVLYVPTGFGDWARRYHVLALAMQHEEQLLGVIYVFRHSDAGGFSDRDLHVLDVFARQAAGALQQARATADLLDLSRIQAGRVALRVGSVDLPMLVSEVIDQLSPRAPRHSIRSTFSASFPAVRGDADHLRRALFNLVQNGIKYSPDGGEILI